MDRNETLAAIAADVRKVARDIDEKTDWDNDLLTCDHSIVDAFNHIADRIEAAAKHADSECRHNEEIAFQRGRQATPGNVATMREALEGVLAWFDEEMGDDCGDMDAMLARVQKALAAPPRNCDCFVTSVDAIAYFNKHNQPLRADPRPNLIDGKKYERFSDWLMDTANGAEKGGE